MLKARNLDDQTYEEIVQAAEGRLPWLCPAWTDHNAHDPGITVLELMAWYKELQQYQMNQFTDGLKWKLLKLAGISPRPAAPAACAVELEPDGPARLPFARLITREGIPFELAEGVPARRPALARVCVAREDGTADVGELLGGRQLPSAPSAGRGRPPPRCGSDSPGWGRGRCACGSRWFPRTACRATPLPLPAKPPVCSAGTARGRRIRRCCGTTPTA